MKCPKHARGLEVILFVDKMTDMVSMFVFQLMLYVSIQKLLGIADYVSTFASVLSFFAFVFHGSDGAVEICALRIRKKSLQNVTKWMLTGIFWISFVFFDCGPRENVGIATVSCEECHVT